MDIKKFIWRGLRMVRSRVKRTWVNVSVIEDIHESDLGSSPSRRFSRFGIMADFFHCIHGIYPIHSCLRAGHQPPKVFVQLSRILRAWTGLKFQNVKILKFDVNFEREYDTWILTYQTCGKKFPFQHPIYNWFQMFRFFSNQHFLTKIFSSLILLHKNASNYFLRGNHAFLQYVQSIF